MNIRVDVWEKFPGYEYQPSEESAFRAIWNFVYDRVFVLLEEIEKEESADKNQKVIMIYLMNHPKRIQCTGYSNALTKKINMSFNETDVSLLLRSAENVLSGVIKSV